MEMWLPRPVWDVIDGLERAGHVAVAVGGCVRDALMGRVPGDYDVDDRAVLTIEYPGGALGVATISFICL